MYLLPFFCAVARQRYLVLIFSRGNHPSTPCARRWGHSLLCILIGLATPPPLDPIRRSSSPPFPCVRPPVLCLNCPCTPAIGPLSSVVPPNPSTPPLHTQPTLIGTPCQSNYDSIFCWQGTYPQQSRISTTNVPYLYRCHPPPPPASMVEWSTSHTLAASVKAPSFTALPLEFTYPQSLSSTPAPLPQNPTSSGTAE